MFDRRHPKFLSSLSECFGHRGLICRASHLNSAFTTASHSPSYFSDNQDRKIRRTSSETKQRTRNLRTVRLMYPNEYSNSLALFSQHQGLLMSRKKTSCTRVCHCTSRVMVWIKSADPEGATAHFVSSKTSNLNIFYLF